MAIFIKEFDINAYRGIQNLKLKELNHINILTGDNNSGKTSVLELIQNVEDPAFVGTWDDMRRKSDNRKGSIFSGFYNMFPIDFEEKLIRYSFCDENDNWREVSLEGQFEETQLAESELFRINGFMRTGAHKKQEDEIMVDTRCLHLMTRINNCEASAFSIYDFQTRLSRFEREQNIQIKTVYITPVDHAMGYPVLKQVLNNTEHYEIMLEILREFDENIISIVTETNGTGVEYMILSKNHRNALPLSVYGDGMKKAILLLGAIVMAKDGILLLDEFETAIHTSAMDTIFSWLLESAMKLNVQIFLTSHSKEAIDKVIRCKEELRPYINLYTLYKKEDKNLVRQMSCEQAINAQESLGLELR